MLPLDPAIRLGQAIAYTFWMSGRAVRDVRSAAPSRRMRTWVQQWAAGLSELAKIEVRVFGAEKLDADTPRILMANHQSYLDVHALYRALPVPFAFLAKKELFALPFFSGVMEELGCVPVDRRNREKAVNAIDAAGEQIRRGSTIVVFPEGTRSRGDRVLPMKKGPFYLAQRAGVPVVPIGLRGTAALMPRRNTGMWSGVSEVHIGDPIPPIPREGNEPRLALMEQVRAELVRLSGLPAIDED
ncbi:MAG: lysophospholipid acyltransferase family protein [Byssovorax sp.]